MKKTMVLLSFVLVAGAAGADEVKKPQVTAKPVTPTTTQAAKPVAQPQELAAEVVAFDANAKTLTIKGEKANQVLSVDDKALASLKEAKAGQKLTLLCQQAKGQKSVVGVKAETKPETQVQPKADANRK